MKIIKYINKILPFFKKKSDINSFKNVLVVSNTGLGDTILGTPAIKTLRKSFPNINITFLVNKKMYPLFEGFQYVDDFILYSTGFINQLVLIMKLRNKKIDTIFLLHSNGPEDIFFSILSGAKNILKMTPNLNHEFKKLFLNTSNKIGQHTIENRLDLIRYFNPSKIDKIMEIGSLYYKENKQIITERENKKIIGIQLGAQDRYKMWPIEKFINLSNKLINEKDIYVVLFGATPLEESLAIQLINSTIHNEKIINTCCKLAIGELPFFIKNLDVLLTNDTGTMHLAISLKIPTLSLFGPTSSKEFGPYQDLKMHRVVQKDGFFVNDKAKKLRTQEGMNLISVEEVYKILKDMLYE